VWLRLVGPGDLENSAATEVSRKRPCALTSTSRRRYTLEVPFATRAKYAINRVDIHALGSFAGPANLQGMSAGATSSTWDISSYRELGSPALARRRAVSAGRQ